MCALYLKVGGALAGVTCALFLLRKAVSRKWGYFKSDRKLNGQVVIITGANIGLGAEAAKDIAARGATLILACRSWDRTRELLGQLRKQSGNNDVHFLKLDLGCLKSVREFADEFKEKYSRLDTLVLNAGLMVPMDKGLKTSDGFEIHAGTNHLGHFLLTNLLKDLLQKTEDSRVVVVASMLMRNGVYDPAKYDHFYTGRAPEGKAGRIPTGYCDTKLMNALFTKQLSVRLPGVTSVCVCPGWCYTNLSTHFNVPLYRKVLLVPIAFLFMRSAARGAHNIIHAAVEDTNKLINGGFYRDFKVSGEDTLRLDGLSESGEELWTSSERLCNL